MSGLRRRGGWTREGLAAAVAVAPAVAVAVVFAVIPANAGIQFDFALVLAGFRRNKGNSKMDPGVHRDDEHEQLDPGVRRDDEQKQPAPAAGRMP